MSLNDIFEKHGLDPFDVFLLDKSEWPQEAQDFVNSQPKPKIIPGDPRDLTEEARREEW